MHETALTGNLIDVALNALSKQKIKRVNCITVSVGVLAGVLPAAMEFAFEAMTAGTILEGSELVLETSPAVMRCSECSYEYESSSFPYTCPVCGSTRFSIVRGEEVFIKTIDCEEE